MTLLRAATVQFRHQADDKTYNLSRIRHFAAAAAADGVKILAFPEMCITGYWHVRNLRSDAVAALAEPVPDGPSVRAVRDLAMQHGMAIGAGLVEAGGDRGSGRGAWDHARAFPIT